MRSACVMSLALVLLLGCQTGPADSAPVEPAAPTPAQRVQVTPDSDQRAIDIAQAVMQKMGGWQNWDATRILAWKFFGGRQHYWDRHSGDIRIEMEREGNTSLWLMNVNTMEGRVWNNGELLEGDELEQALTRGHKIWINDSYWVVMPYKLLDAGVTLKYSGEREMDDRHYDVLDMTFAEGVGYTPENRYEIFVGRDSGLLEHWSFFPQATDKEPRFTMPWERWEPFGAIMLATGRGGEEDWAIVVYDELPRSLFTSPDPVSM